MASEIKTKKDISIGGITRFIVQPKVFVLISIENEF